MKLNLKKQNILRERKQFQTVYSEGKSYASRDMVMYVLKSEEYAGKVAFAAGKKLGCAVVRNRVKRLLRECYRLNQYKIKPGYALILIGRNAMVKKKRQEVELSFIELLKKAKIFAGDEA